MGRRFYIVQGYTDPSKALSGHGLSHHALFIPEYRTRSCTMPQLWLVSASRLGLPCCLSSARRYVRRMHQLLVKSVRHSGAQCGIAYKLVLRCSLSFRAHTPMCIAFMTLSRAP